jgi:signal transduction histidine kinase
MSEIARRKMEREPPAELDKISRSADEVLSKMNAIIWSMNSGNDSLDNLVSYIRSYAQEYLDQAGISARFEMPEEVPSLEISGDKRRNLFLCVKETMNNCVKHAAATELSIRIETEPVFRLIISDNGKGLPDTAREGHGNGLRNMSRRMEAIGGQFSIRNENGTITELSLPSAIPAPQGSDPEG